MTSVLDGGGPRVLTEVSSTTAPDGSLRLDGIVDDRWQIVHAQGGAAMAAMLEAAGAVIAEAGRDDLVLAGAATTFSRPLPCGSVALLGEALRISRSGAQVSVAWHDPAAGVDAGPAAVTSAVFARPDPAWPAVTGAVWPPALAVGPDPGQRRLGAAESGDTQGFAFFRTTEWRVVPEDAAPPTACRVWFRFDPSAVTLDGVWPPALLAVPADALGCAAVPAVAGAGAPVFALSLQMILAVLGPVAGPWVGIDSHCLQAADGLTTGTATLWDEGRRPVAAVTQTALLRRMAPG
jgi:hypothetical protein